MVPGWSHRLAGQAGLPCQPSFVTRFDLDTACATAPWFDKVCRDVHFLLTGTR